ncbi:hypothetical protein PR048_032223 [Dryococelus australis]|uniref:Uncharacterized protein n=1 Tax=Dryococelus australis TaxID=614101 RepID=A0ABQ9G1M2_9NEOP|nr:hypothetical protein PR048_032223 [Dryococelus australis]
MAVKEAFKQLVTLAAARIAVAERLGCPPPIKANWVQSPAGSLSVFPSQRQPAVGPRYVMIERGLFRVFDARFHYVQWFPKCGPRNHLEGILDETRIQSSFVAGLFLVTGRKLRHFGFVRPHAGCLTDSAVSCWLSWGCSHFFLRLHSVAGPVACGELLRAYVDAGNWQLNYSTGPSAKAESIAIVFIATWSRVEVSAAPEISRKPSPPRRGRRPWHDAAGSRGVLLLHPPLSLKDARPRNGCYCCGDSPAADLSGVAGQAGSIWGRSAPVSLPASHKSDPGSFPGRVTPDFRTWELCRSAGFLGDLPFPPLFYSGAAPDSSQSPSSALRNSILGTFVGLRASSSFHIEDHTELNVHCAMKISQMPCADAAIWRRRKAVFVAPIYRFGRGSSHLSLSTASSSIVQPASLALHCLIYSQSQTSIPLVTSLAARFYIARNSATHSLTSSNSTPGPEACRNIYTVRPDHLECPTHPELH